MCTASREQLWLSVSVCICAHLRRRGRRGGGSRFFKTWFYEIHEWVSDCNYYIQTLNGFFDNAGFKKLVLVTEQWPGLLIGSQTLTWTTTATKCYEVKGGGGKGAPRCVNSRRERILKPWEGKIKRVRIIEGPTTTFPQQSYFKILGVTFLCLSPICSLTMLIFGWKLINNL